MFVLHVELRLKPGCAAAVEKAFSETFQPAISAQDGFRSVLLLRPRSEESAYRLAIAFQDERSQKKWVETPLHQQVWPMLETHCSGYDVKTYDSV